MVRYSAFLVKYIHKSLKGKDLKDLSKDEKKEVQDYLKFMKKYFLAYENKDVDNEIS